jgi:site-specific recombinase XerD
MTKGDESDLERPADDRPPLPAQAAPRRTPLEPQLARAIERFLESQRAPRTRSEYRKAIEDFLRKAEISDLKGFLQAQPDQVVSYRNRLQERGLSATTIRLRLAALSGLFGGFVVRGELAGNPADPKLVKRLRVNDVSKTEGLTLEEVEALLSTCNGTLRGLRDRALLMTLYYEGLRRSEASKLSYRDLTTRRGLLEVRNAKNSDYDTIKLRPEVRQAIEDYLEVLSRDLRRRETRPEDPVFVSLSKRTFGKRLSAYSINQTVKAHVRDAGIERRITAHSMRHTVTTHALGAGAPLHQVQRHLRHKDVRTTLRYERDRDVRKNPTLDMLPPVG